MTQFFSRVTHKKKLRRCSLDLYFCQAYIYYLDNPGHFVLHCITKYRVCLCVVLHRCDQRELESTEIGASISWKVWLCLFNLCLFRFGCVSFCLSFYFFLSNLCVFYYFHFNLCLIVSFFSFIVLTFVYLGLVASNFCLSVYVLKF